MIITNRDKLSYAISCNQEEYSKLCILVDYGLMNYDTLLLNEEQITFEEALNAKRAVMNATKSDKYFEFNLSNLDFSAVNSMLGTIEAMHEELNINEFTQKEVNEIAEKFIGMLSNIYKGRQD